MYFKCFHKVFSKLSDNIKNSQRTDLGELGNLHILQEIVENAETRLRNFFQCFLH